MHSIPLLLEPQQLVSLLQPDQNGLTGDKSLPLLIFDLSKLDNYKKRHLPGAIHINYNDIVLSKKPVFGLLPDVITLNHLGSRLGIDANQHIIAYDDEGNANASRLLWTLEACGHSAYSLLNGGMTSWIHDGYPTENIINTPTKRIFNANLNPKVIANKEYILSRLNQQNTLLLDTRTLNEYKGLKLFAARGGHIPGAIHYEWTNAIDLKNNYRLRPANELLDELAQLGITQEKEIITYCQAHHRSSFSFIMLKYLGFNNIKGYHGAWSDWGNQTDTPVEL